MRGRRKGLFHCEKRQNKKMENLEIRNISKITNFLIFATRVAILVHCSTHRPPTHIHLCVGELGFQALLNCFCIFNLLYNFNIYFLTFFHFLQIISIRGVLSEPWRRPWCESWSEPWNEP